MGKAVRNQNMVSGYLWQVTIINCILYMAMYDKMICRIFFPLEPTSEKQKQWVHYIYPFFLKENWLIF